MGMLMTLHCSICGNTQGNKYLETVIFSKTFKDDFPRK